MKDLLDELDSLQQEAVTTTEGPCLVLAGPGTGKTKVLTTRIAYLLIKKNIKPYNILALTFSDKAAHDMCKNISKMTNKNVNDLLCGTFYSCFAKILREECSVIGYNQFFSIYDSTDSINLLEDIIQTKDLNKDNYKADEIAAKISLCKNRIITAEDYNKNSKFLEKDKKDNIEYFGELYREYEAKCKKNNAMDFDDLLLNTYLLLKKNTKVCNKYQEMFKYILIDEFQDVSKIQYDLVKIISEKHHNLCVAGDAEQSIYSFWGGEAIASMSCFKKDFKNCKVFKMEQTYRSAKKITNISNSVIAYNTKVIPKKIITKDEIEKRNKATKGNKNSNEGQVDIVKTLTPTEEAHAVAAFIDNIKGENFKYSDIAVLYRTNSQVPLLKAAFNQTEIKYKTYGTTSLLQKKIIKSIIGYLRVLINPSDDEGIKLSINEPCRGLGGGILKRIYNTVRKAKTSLWEAFTAKNEIFDKKSRDLLAKYIKIIQNGMHMMAATQNAYEITNFVLNDIRILEKIKRGKTEKDKQNYADIVQFLNITKAFVDDENNIDKSLSAFLQNLPFKDDSFVEDHSDAVSLIPVHKSKGLEFRCVCILGLNEGIFPLTTENIEAERRLFYVAITRSKDILGLFFSENINKNGILDTAPKSRFLNEIDEEHKENFKKIENIKKTKTKDHTKYSIFNFSFISKRSRTKNIIKVNSPDLLEIGRRCHYTHYGWGTIKGTMTCMDMTFVDIEFEEWGRHRMIYDPSKILIYS